MADISKIKLPDGNTYDVKDTSKSSATNWVNGSQDGSVRMVSSRSEDSSYTIGRRAVAEGNSTEASGDNSHAEGGETKATGTYSHAEGYVTTASQARAHAEGYHTIASGYNAHAEGYYATASGNTAHAEGYYTEASGQYSHAEGYYTIANKYTAHSEGENTTASGDSSHAEGVYTIANHVAQHVFGQYNVADDSTAAASSRGNYVEIVGNGTGPSARSNARTLDWSGNEVLAGKLTVGVAGTNSLDVATIGQLPTKTSDLTNDSGFITADSDEKLRVWDIAGQSSTLGYIIIGNGTSAQIRSYDSLNFYYNLTKGTTSSGGTAELILGNGLDDTTDKNTRGQIRLYGAKNNSTLLRTSVVDNNNTINLPNASGTIALTSDIPDVSGFITSETDPVFSASAAASITDTNINSWNNANSLQWNNSSKELRVAKNNVMTTVFSKSDLDIPTKTSDLTNDSGYITGYTETDPVFSASAAAGITSTDISNWNSKVSDDKTWNGVTLNTQGASTTVAGQKVPVLLNTQATEATLLTVSSTPTAYCIPKYDGYTYIYSTTPSANDNSTKVATTAYVDNAVGATSIPIASNSTLGGIKVGQTLDIDSDGILNTNIYPIYIVATYDYETEIYTLTPSIPLIDIVELLEQGKDVLLYLKGDKKGGPYQYFAYNSMDHRYYFNCNDVRNYGDQIRIYSYNEEYEISYYSHTSSQLLIDNLTYGALIYSGKLQTLNNDQTTNDLLLPNKSGTIALASDIPSKTSDLTNDSGFITGYTETDPVFTASAAHGISTTDITNWNSKQAALVSGTNIKTINNESLLGSGNITITGGLQNLVDGSATGSVRGINTFTDDSSFTQGDYATQLGTYSGASGTASFAVGFQAVAEGTASQAEGYRVSASGHYAHAEGFSYTQARGNSSHAQNEGTIASSKSQTTMGEYNVIDTAGTASTRGAYALIIGNGTSDSARSNALTVDWSGNVNIPTGASYQVNGVPIGGSQVQIVRWTENLTTD